MIRTLATLLAAASALTAVHAHATIQKIEYDGKSVVGYLPYVHPYTPPLFPPVSMRKLAGNGPVDDLDSPDMMCGKGSDKAKLVETVAAGTTMTMHWAPWDVSHKGAVLSWLARAPDGIDVRDWDLSGAKWFKFAQEGWSKERGWASTDVMMGKNGNSWPVTIPANLKPGQYILRHELHALHQAFGYPGLQAYPNCIQLEVTGNGNAIPTEGLVSFPGGYKRDEPGWVYNIYMKNGDFSDYVVPGGPVWDGTSSSVAGGGAPAPAPAPPANTPAPSSSDANPPATSPTAASPAPAETYPAETYPATPAAPAESSPAPAAPAASSPAPASPAPSADAPPSDQKPDATTTPAPIPTPQTLAAAAPPAATPTTVSGRCRRSGTIGRRMNSKSKRAHRRAVARVSEH